MNLLIRPQTEEINGLYRPIHVTPQSAGWQYVTFSVYHLRRGQTLAGAADGKETALVVLSGVGEADLDGRSVGHVGERLSVFEEQASYTLYLGEYSSYRIRCMSDTMEVALVAAPATGRALPARVLRPEEAGVEIRGEGNRLRRIQHLLDTDQDAERLLIVEVITPAGNWSSFPPHKHDTENPPHEAYLEETYYHHVQPSNGFAFQRVYSYDDGPLDETVTVHDGDLVLVPKGYHTVGALPGCDLYYLNVMAGPNRAWLYQVDPAFRHMLPPSGQITGTIIRGKR
jgi:5-deoxy-glucuronate isomerase